MDPDAVRRYQAMEGPLGDELRSCLREDDGTWSFRLTEHDDCPFLRSDGLCRLILELGEDSLCDICALHPRFFQDVGGHELAGLGLCCEAVAALLLSGRGELRFLTDEDVPLSLEQVLRLLGQAPDRDALRFSPRIDRDYYQTVFRRYARCEAIDDAWSRDLSTLSACPEEAVRQAGAYAEQYYDREVFDRVYGYILFRQLEHLETCGLPALLRYAREATDFIFLWAAGTGDLPECLRRWSAEMEYSEENVAFLLKSI